MKPIPATYETECPLCGCAIVEEEPIVKVDDLWVHDHCAEDWGEEVD
jgi:hypothetical protein